MAAEEIMLIVNKIEGHTVQDQSLDPNVLAAPANTDFKVEKVFHLIAKFGMGHVIVWQNDTNFMAILDQ